MKRIICAALICLTIAGIAIISTIGLNVDLIYAENNRIDIKINKSFDIKDVKEISQEVLGKQKVIVQKVELFEDMVSITVKNVTDEQVNEINNRINEKYGISNTMNDIAVTYSPNVKLRTILKPYIIPISIAVVCILAYMGFHYRKLGIVKTIAKAVAIVFITEISILNLIAVTRFQVSRIVIPIALIAFVVSMLLFGIHQENRLQEIQEKEQNNKGKKK